METAEDSATFAIEVGVYARQRGDRMAGRYQGYHRVQNGKDDRGVEVLWQQNGWFWRPLPSGHMTGSKNIGPFTTSTEAYHDACQRLARGSSGASSTSTF
jgi:hypothetical protein